VSRACLLLEAPICSKEVISALAWHPEEVAGHPGLACSGTCLGAR